MLIHPTSRTLHQWPTPLRSMWWALAAIGVTLAAGCSSRLTGPTVIHLEPVQYASAFDAALTASDDHGFAPTLRDRRRGIIETQPLISPSALEPWRTEPYTFEQVIENTNSLQRRRVRWEFTARALPGEAGEGVNSEDLLDLHAGADDLTATTRPIELRVAVVVERAYRPGTRPSVWTTSDTTRAVVIDPETGVPVDSNYWTPLARDEHYEAILLGLVQSALQAGSDGSQSPSAAAHADDADTASE